MHVHDTVTGLHATRIKEELQKEIEDQIQMGGEGLAEDYKTYCRSIWGIWIPHPEKDKNTGSLT